jgi:hypothetical protein
MSLFYHGRKLNSSHAPPAIAIRSAGGSLEFGIDRTMFGRVLGLFPAWAAAAILNQIAIYLLHEWL